MRSQRNRSLRTTWSSITRCAFLLLTIHRNREQADICDWRHHFVNSSDQSFFLRLAVQLPQGTFSGTVLTPSMTRPAPMRGIIDRATGTGIGYFLTPTASGLVIIEP
jgi:hypothetical protein